MGDVIRFPSRCSTIELEEVFDFGSVGDLTVTLVREKGNVSASLTVAILSEDETFGFQGVMAFKPEGYAMAAIVGEAVMRTLRAVEHSSDLRGLGSTRG
jgi:hypothetical protein